MSATLRISNWTLAVSGKKASLAAPVFALDQVRVGPSPRDPDYDAHIAASRGSSMTWGDEWRFDGGLGELVSLIWHIPEVNVPPPAALPEPRPATLRLVTMGGEIDMPTTRSFTPDLLVCGRGAGAAPTAAFRIAPGLGVLAENGDWWGWALERPLDYLAGGPAPAELGPLVSRWYEIVSDATLDALMDVDPALGDEITRLHARVLALAHPAAEGVAAHMLKVRENFFDL